MGQPDHDGVGDFDFFHPGGGLNGPGEPLVIGHGVLQGGNVHNKVQCPVFVFKNDAAGAHGLLGLGEDGNFFRGAQVGGLHPGLIGGGDVRHQHGHVLDDPAGAAQPPAVGKFFVADVQGFGAFHRALHQLDPAFAAGAVAGAGSVNGYVGPAGQFQEIFTGVAFNDDRASAFNLEGYFHGSSSFQNVFLLFFTAESRNKQGFWGL